MSDKLYSFTSHQNFKNEYFYYFLPHSFKKNEIGEKITKYNGVNIHIYYVI